MQAKAVFDWSAVTVITCLAVALFILAIIGLGCSSPVAHDGNVLLRWTAPGDDGDIGTASVYDLRYHTEPLTIANWYDAPVRLASAPAPMIAGTIQEYTVTGLTVGVTYYFGIKTADEQGNWSGISNIVEADGQPPEDIESLEVVSIP